MKELSVSEFIQHISEVIRQPELHMREIPILIGLVVLLLFAVIIIISIVIIRPDEKRGEEEPAPVDEHRLQLSIKRRFIAVAVFGALSLLSTGYAAMNSSGTGFCAGCHEMKRAHESSLKTVHGKVECLSCHQEPGISGVFIEKLQLLDMMIAKLKAGDGVTSAQVTNEACLRCHKGVLKNVTTTGTIKMKHKEPVEAGYRCTDCHSSEKLFHIKRKPLDSFEMSRCVDCHNQKKASADCNVCHVNAKKAAMRVDQDEYPKVNLPKTVPCRNCHMPGFCSQCHPVRVPHSWEWSSGGHALQAFTKSDLCLQCHTRETCQKCHTKPSPHGSDWVKAHGPASKTSPAWCANCHRAPQFCLLCHTDSTRYRLKR